MAKKKRDAFKKFDKDQIFVIGTDSEERCKILYIRSGMAPGAIRDRLSKWGDEIPLTRIRGWIKKGKWADLRKSFKETYSTEVHIERAKQTAVKDVSDENEVRGVYAQISGEIVNSIKQKLYLSKTPDSPFSTLSSQELESLSETLERTQKVHHRALGIPELIKIDPTSGFEGIRIIPAHEAPAIETDDEK